MDSKLYHLLFLDDDKDFLHSMNMGTSSKQFAETDGVEIESHLGSRPPVPLEVGHLNRSKAARYRSEAALVFNKSQIICFESN